MSPAEAKFVAQRAEAHRDDLEATQSIVDPFEASGIWRVVDRCHDETIYESAPELSQRYPSISIRLGVPQAC